MAWSKVGVLVVLVLSSSLLLADEMGDIRARKEIKVGIRRASLPFGQLDLNGKPAGYDVDFATAVAHKLGANPVFVETDLSSSARLLESGSVDLVVAALPRTPDRERQMAFSRGYYVSSVKVLAPTGKIKSEQALNGKLICVTRDSDLERELPRNFSEVTPTGAQTYDDAIAKFVTGNCDAIAGDEGVLRYYLPKLPNSNGMAISDFGLLLQIYGMAVRKGSTGLLAAVNSALTELERSGEAEKIFRRWFSGKQFDNFYRTFRVD